MLLEGIISYFYLIFRILITKSLLEHHQTID